MGVASKEYSSADYVSEYSVVCDGCSDEVGAAVAVEDVVYSVCASELVSVEASGSDSGAVDSGDTGWNMCGEAASDVEEEDWDFDDCDGDDCDLVS